MVGGDDLGAGGAAAGDDARGGQHDYMKLGEQDQVHSFVPQVGPHVVVLHAGLSADAPSAAPGTHGNSRRAVRLHAATGRGPGRRRRGDAPAEQGHATGADGRDAPAGVQLWQHQNCLNGGPPDPFRKWTLYSSCLFAGQQSSMAIKHATSESRSAQNCIRAHTVLASADSMSAVMGPRLMADRIFTRCASW